MQNSCAISQADELAAFLQGSVRQNFLYQECDVKIPDEILLGSATCLEIAAQLVAGSAPCHHAVREAPRLDPQFARTCSGAAITDGDADEHGWCV